MVNFGAFLKTISKRVCLQYCDNNYRNTALKKWHPIATKKEGEIIIPVLYSSGIVIMKELNNKIIDNFIILDSSIYKVYSRVHGRYVPVFCWTHSAFEYEGKYLSRIFVPSPATKLDWEEGNYFAFDFKMK